MIKHILFLIVLTVILFLAMPYCQNALHWLLDVHAWVLNGLNHVFAGGKAAALIKNILALLAIPFSVGVILGGIYWIIQRSLMPYLFTIMWFVWLILVVALVK